MNSRIRFLGSIAFSGLLSVALIICSLGFWAERSVLNESVFTRNAEKIIETPEVLATISTYVVDETLQLVPMPTGLGSKALSDLLRRAIERQVQRVLSTSSIQKPLLIALSNTHEQFVLLVESKTEVLVFDVGPVVSEVITGLRNQGEIPGFNVIDNGAGVLNLYGPGSDDSIKKGLADARRVIDIFQRVLLLLVMLIAILGLVVLWLSPTKLIGLRSILIATIFGAIVNLFILKSLSWWIPGLINEKSAQVATKEIVDVLTQSWSVSLMVVLAVSFVATLTTLRKR